MAIRVHHGVSPAAVAGAGFGGGQGRSRAAAMRGGAAANAREQAQIRQIGAQAQQAQSERAFRSQQAELGRDFQREQAHRQFDFGTIRQLQAFDLQQQSAEAAQARGREDLEYGLTTKQRMELQRLADAEAQAMSNPNFSEAEKRDLQYRFAQRRAGVQPVARPREMTAADKFKANTHRDPSTGRVFALNPDGSVGKPIIEPPEKQMSHDNRLELAKLAMQASMGDDGFDPAKFQTAFSSLMQQYGGALPGAGDPETGRRPLPKFRGDMQEQNEFNRRVMSPSHTGQTFAGPDMDDLINQGFANRGDVFGPDASPPAQEEPTGQPPAGQPQPIGGDPAGIGGQSTLRQPPPSFTPETGKAAVDRIPNMPAPLRDIEREKLGIQLKLRDIDSQELGDVTVPPGEITSLYAAEQRIGATMERIRALAERKSMLENTAVGPRVEDAREAEVFMRNTKEGLKRERDMLAKLQRRQEEIQAERAKLVEDAEEAEGRRVALMIREANKRKK